MDYKELFEKYQASLIENNNSKEELTSLKITLDQLASKAYSSKFHYHRTFQAMVGEPVMEYVRKRRVTFAANEILRTNRKLMDIAYSSGFCSQVVGSKVLGTILSLFVLIPAAYAIAFFAGM